MIKTRIAPSPTGLAHVGTAYTALLNFAFAKKNDGQFILRIEDTDQKRNVPDGEKVILDGLKWLGIVWDGEPVWQSKRLELYKKEVDRLISEGKAYEEDGGIILKVDKSEGVSWKDLIRGEISFPKEELKDFAILKKDGFPAYNFAVVVDDHAMGITHVLRGEDHISNTPRQILAYKALGYDVPEFGHTPLLRNSQKAKLSKRKDVVSLTEYKNQGYLPEAMVNFLALLGWSHPEGKEIFSFQEFVEKFTLERVQSTGPVFNVDKLNWLNAEYIRNLSDDELLTRLSEFTNEKFSSDLLTKIIPLIKPRIQKLSEFTAMAAFFITKPDVDKALLSDKSAEHLSLAISSLESIDNWSVDQINEKFSKIADDDSVHNGKFFMDVRIALTGRKVTPPLNDSIFILGKSESLSRLEIFEN